MCALLVIYLSNLAVHVLGSPPPPDLFGLLHGILLTEFVGVPVVSRWRVLVFDAFWFVSQLLLFCIIYSEGATAIDHDIPELLTGESVVSDINVWKILRSNWNCAQDEQTEEQSIVDSRDQTGSSTQRLLSPTTQDVM